MLRQVVTKVGVFLGRVADRCGCFTEYRGWDIVAAFGIAMFVLLTATPSYERFDPSRWDLRALEWKLRHPLEAIPAEQFNPSPQSGEWGTYKHLEKRTFRIAIPLLAYTLGLNLSHLIILQHAVAIFFIWLSIRLAWRLSGDRVIALLQGIAFGFMFVGTWGFQDFVYYDGMAYCLMLIGITSSHAAIIFLSVLLASFTDERAFINAPFLAAYWLLVSPKPRLWMAVAAGGGAYVLARLSLVFFLGLKTGTADILNPVVTRSNMMSLPLSLPLLFEGTWMLVVAGFAILMVTGRRRWALGLTVLTLISLLTAVAVIDFTRSAAYAFPLLWICFAIIVSTETTETIRKLMVVIAMINVIFPTHHFMFGVHLFLPIFRLM